MRIRCGDWKTLVLWAAVLPGAASPASAQAESERFPMRVVVYDHAGVAPEVLGRARSVVSAIFGDIGVDPIWLSVPEFARQLPDGNAARRAFMTAVIQVRIVPPAMHQALGLSNNALGAAHRAARMVWISIEKIRHWADGGRIDPGDALGYVIAHELGHVLLRVNGHSVTGLMRDMVDPDLVAHNKLSFLDQEAALIRANLAAPTMSTRSR
jgi:hypothetical protein